MSNAVINFNTDAKLKNEAKKVLSEMGLTLSVALNASLRKIIAERKVEFTAPEVPNARLRKAMKESRQEIKSGNYQVFTNHEDFEKYLLS